MTSFSTLNGLHCERCLLEDGWARDVLLRFDDRGRIIAIERNASTLDGDTAIHLASAEKARGPVIAGMPNLHSHAFQRAMAGLTEVAGPGADSFWSWRDVMYGFIRRLTPDSIQAVAAMAYAEMLEQGFTSVAEFHYLHHGADGTPYADRAETSRRVLAAASATGIASTHLPVLYNHGGFGGQPAGDGQRPFLNTPDQILSIIEACRATPGDHRVGLALHSLRAVTPDEMDEAVRGITALDPTAPIHIHISEQTAEVDACIAWSGKRPVEWLMDRGIADDRWCLIHATHVTDAEVRAIADSGAVVGLCLTTEADLGDGLYPVKTHLEAGGRIGVGSDSQVIISAAEEIRLMEWGQRLVTRRRNWLAPGPGASTGAYLYGQSVAGGARALGHPEPATGIRIGQRADLVVLDDQSPRLYGRDGSDLIDSYVFASSGNAVRDVLVGGRVVVRDGRHVDAERIRADWRTAVDSFAAKA